MSFVTVVLETLAVCNSYGSPEHGFKGPT